MWLQETMRHQMSRLARHSIVRYGVASILPRGTAILTAFALAPLGMSRLGPVEFGFFILATQVPNLVVAPDLGLGNGIVNEVSEAQRRDGNVLAVRAQLVGLARLLRLVAAGWFLVGGVAAFVYVTATLDHQSEQSRLFTALVLGLGCFVAGIPATVWRRVQLAQEVGHRSMIWEGVGKVVALLACIAVLLLAPDLRLLVVAFVLPPSLALWINAATFVRREFGGLDSEFARPSTRAAFSANRHVFKIGKYFVLLQVCYVLSVAIDPFLINAAYSTSDVTYLNILRRPYDALPLIVSLFSLSFWPVFSRLHTSGQARRLRMLAIGSAATSFLVIAIVGLGILGASAPLYSFLGQGYVEPSRIDLLWITLHVSASASLMVMVNLLNALGEIRSQAAIMAISTICIISAKLAVLQIGDIHTFIAIATICYVSFSVLPLTILAMRRLPVVDNPLTPPSPPAQKSTQ